MKVLFNTQKDTPNGKKSLTNLGFGFLLISLTLLMTINCGGGGEGNLDENDKSKKGEPSVLQFNKFSRSKAARIFNPETIKPYNSFDELKADLGLVAENHIVSRYLKREEVDIQYYIDNPERQTVFEEESDYGDTVALSVTSASLSSFDSNNQVDGINEPDVIKSDGQIIYRIHKGNIYVINKSGTLLQKVSSEHQFDKLHMSEFRVIAFAKTEDYRMKQTHVYTYKRQSDGTLEFVSSRKNNFSLISSRRIGDRLYVAGEVSLSSLVNNSGIHDYFENILNTDDINKYLTINKLDYHIARYNAIKENMTNGIKTICDHLVNELYKTNGQIDSELVTSTMKLCRMISSSKAGDVRDVELENESTPTSLVELQTIDVQNEARPIQVRRYFSTSSYQKQNIYANNEQMIVALGSRVIDPDSQKSFPSTSLMAFDISTNGLELASIGVVAGSLKNQFSMDIQDGLLRIVTTMNEGYRIRNWNSRSYRPSSEVPEPFTVTVCICYGYGPQSEGWLTVFDMEDSTMTTKGRLTAIGSSEVTSVKFINDTVYISLNGSWYSEGSNDTFVTIDLSDPANITQTGSLEGAGRSTDLIQLDDDRLLAIGSYWGETNDSFTVSANIHHLDVSDDAKPVILSSHLTPSWERGNSDHHRYRYISSVKTLILPVNPTLNSSNDFALIKIDADDSLSSAGNIDHKNVNFDWYPRSLLIEGVLLTFKGETVLAHNFTTLDQLWSLKLQD